MLFLFASHGPHHAAIGEVALSVG